MANKKTVPKVRKVKRGDKWYKVETVKTETLVPTTAPVRSAKQKANDARLAILGKKNGGNPNTKKK